SWVFGHWDQAYCPNRWRTGYDFDDILDGTSNTIAFAEKYGRCDSNPSTGNIGGSLWAWTSHGAFDVVNDGNGTNNPQLLTYAPLIGHTDMPSNFSQANGWQLAVPPQFAPNDANCTWNTGQGFTIAGCQVLMLDGSVKTFSGGSGTSGSV